MAAAGRGDSGSGFDVVDPGAAAFVAGESPNVLLVVGEKTFERKVAGENGIGRENGDGAVEVRGEIDVDREELRSAFAMRIMLGFEGERRARDGLIERAASLAGLEGVAIDLERGIGVGGAGENEVRIDSFDLEDAVGVGNTGEGFLERSGESGGGLTIAMSEMVEVVALGAVDIIGEIMPKTTLEVAVVAMDLYARRSASKTEAGDAIVTNIKNVRESDGLRTDSELTKGEKVGA